MKKLKSLITRYKPSFTDSIHKYLTHNKFETSNFYGLPKIHKLEVLQKVIKEQTKELFTISGQRDLKLKPMKRGPKRLKPIKGGPKCPTIRLSN